MEKYYIIEEKELIKLLTTYNKAIALECGGVDNWEWYGASIRDYIDEHIRENNITFTDEEDEWDFTLKDIAIDDLKYYKPYEKE